MDVFVKYNQEVYRQVKSKPSLGAHLRHASKYQLKQAYDRITNSVMVSTLLQRKSGNLDVYKYLRRVLRAPSTNLPPTLTFLGRERKVRTVQEIIADDNKKDMNSWHYKLPKDAPEEVVVRYRRLLDLRRFCPLCKKVCMRRGSENAKWKIVGGHSKVDGKRGRP